VGADKAVTVPATVVEERPSLVFQVVLENQQKVLAHLVGTVKRNFVRLVPGDRVEVELSPHDPTRGRITRKIDHESSRIGKKDLR
jgi:translation initiation factor IF-1